MDATEQEIQQLVRKAKSGDSESFGKLYDIFQPRIYRYFYFRTSPRETAEDLTQTVFLEMIRSLDRYIMRESARFSTWLFQIAHHRLIDHYRKNKISISIDALNENTYKELQIQPSEPLFDTRHERVVQLFMKLPPRYKEVLRMTLVDGLDTAEVAKLLGTTPLHVRVLKFRGIKKLKALADQSL